MSGRWAHYTYQDQSSAEFQIIFQKTGFSAIELLDIDSIIDQVKRSGSKFTLTLIQYKQIVLDLIDIALRPEYFSKQNKIQINLDMTYKSIEILTNLTDQFSDYLMGLKKPQQKNEDEVLQQQIQQPKDYFVLIHMFKLLQDKYIEQTPASYMSKLITPLVYQKSQQLMHFFQQHSQVIELLQKSFYSKSISDLFVKIIELEDSTNTNFFEKDKLNIILKLIPQLQKEQNVQILQQFIQNFAALLENLLQKNDDKFDKTKYYNLVRELINQKKLYEYFIQTSKKHHNNPQVQSLCFKSLNIMLRFNTSQKLNNISSKMSDSNLDSSVTEMKINSQVIKLIQNYLINSQQQILGGLFKSSIIFYYKIILSITIIDNDFINKLINADFIKRIFQKMIDSPRNNILHNIQKQIILETIKKTDNGYQNILESNFLNLTKKVLTEKNSQNCYENQLYHILNAIFNKITIKFGYLENSNLSKQIKEQLVHLKVIMLAKTKFYSAQIGGNPRKQSNSWDCQSNQIILSSLNPNQVLGKSQEVLKQEKTEFENNINDHWLHSQLPLQSDSSSDNDQKIELKELANDEKQQLEVKELFVNHFEKYLPYQLENLILQIQ